MMDKKDKEYLARQLKRFLKARLPVRPLSRVELKQAFDDWASENETATRSKGIERFITSSVCGRDDIPVAGFTKKPFNASVAEHGIAFVPWDAVYGTAMKVFTRSAVPYPQQSLLMSGTPAFQQLRQGQLKVVFSRLGQPHSGFLYDLRGDAELLGYLQQQLDYLIEFEKEPNHVLIRHEAILRATTVPVETFGRYFGPLDWLQHGWCAELNRLMPLYLSALREAREKIDASGLLRASEATGGHDADHDILLRIAPENGWWFWPLVSPFLAGDATKLYRDYAERILHDDDCLGLLLVLLRCHHYGPLKLEAPVLEFLEFLGAAVAPAVQLGPAITQLGTRILTLNSGTRKTEFVKLSPELFQRAAADPRSAEGYWSGLPQSILVDFHRLLRSHDSYISRDERLLGWKGTSTAQTAEELKEATQGLLNEAVATKAWTVPPAALIKFAIGPFVEAELHEIDSDVYFAWVSSQGSREVMSVNPSQGNFFNTLVFRERYEDCEKLTALLELTMAAIVRDFWVVEDHHLVFAIKRERRAATKSEAKKTRVVYLPRIRYDREPRVGALSEGLNQRERGQHFVRWFFRRANPTPVQLAIAARSRVTVPEGYTYVRPHYRGAAPNNTVYKSRSALRLLFESVEVAVPNDAVTDTQDWFTFERNIAVLLRRLGFSVEMKKPRGGSTDHGVDVFATKSKRGEIEDWLIQCKCYGKQNPVGPDIVRALLGSIADFETDQRRFRGMIATTSRFTPEAQRLALKHDVTLIDGGELADICAAEERAAQPSG